MSLKTHDGRAPRLLRGRGATLNLEGRFARTVRVRDAEHVQAPAFDPDDLDHKGDRAQIATHVTPIRARSILSHNDSPDLPFHTSINPYVGCEHGCSYCYARPSHATLDLSPGLDFETRLFAKTNAAQLLREALAKPGYRCENIALGANTDPYQPAERDWRVTRSVLEVLAQTGHPVGIVTKNALVLRDLDLLSDMARRGLVQVLLSVTTLDHDIARRLEPRASSPTRRIETLAALHAAGVPCGVLVAPVVPFLTDDAIEPILEAAAAAGASRAGWVLLRLPHEVRTLFRDWLVTHFPAKAQHVMRRMQAMRGGRDYDADFSTRGRGTGVFAELLEQRFTKACARLGLDRDRRDLDTSQFRAPRPDVAASPQLALF
ncbi:MAG: PA0069 family radical SAM protein [Burkholderiales bacterium]|jgi:DNA repair photolyase|nr:PA0069 family radical SAM protein [Burkholderiales bacterium]